jgi:hypothetical protein
MARRGPGGGRCPGPVRWASAQACTGTPSGRASAPDDTVDELPSLRVCAVMGLAGPAPGQLGRAGLVDSLRLGWAARAGRARMAPAWAPRGQRSSLSCRSVGLCRGKRPSWRLPRSWTRTGFARAPGRPLGPAWAAQSAAPGRAAQRLAGLSAAAAWPVLTRRIYLDWFKFFLA